MKCLQRQFDSPVNCLRRGVWHCSMTLRGLQERVTECSCKYLAGFSFSRRWKWSFINDLHRTSDVRTRCGVGNVVWWRLEFEHLISCPEAPECAAKMNFGSEDDWCDWWAGKICPSEHLCPSGARFLIKKMFGNWITSRGAETKPQTFPPTLSWLNFPPSAGGRLCWRTFQSAIISNFGNSSHLHKLAPGKCSETLLITLGVMRVWKLIFWAVKFHT